MKGFKDSTKVQYMSGGMVGDAKMPMKKACGGSVKMPMKKGNGGDVKMPSPAESAASGNRMAEMEAKEERMLMRRAARPSHRRHRPPGWRCGCPRSSAARRRDRAQVPGDPPRRA
jgi:hypothetical protein